jgi:hypothetical protein
MEKIDRRQFLFRPMNGAEMAALRSRLRGVAPGWARFLHDHDDRVVA